MIHKDSKKVARWAQSEADQTGADHGIEKRGHDFRAWRLPQAKNRFGYELRCEVRHCTDLKRTLPGHGHAATEAVK